ncbi:MAG: hypothetical protein GEU95_10600 [Rhizobiales bacterium]|nr:hypothetical protein [Hyphomicrobiales bacterium]
MRKSLIVVATATVVLVAESLLSSPVQAMTLNGAAGVRLASDAINPVETVACWRNGARGWGWYPYCGPRIYGVWDPDGGAAIDGAAVRRGTAIGVADRVGMPADTGAVAVGMPVGMVVVEVVVMLTMADATAVGIAVDVAEAW